MITKHFIEKLAACLVIVAAILYFNHLMNVNSELEKANGEIVNLSAELEKANGQLETLQAAGVPGVVYGTSYQDGIYSGAGEGEGGPISLQVTIEGGLITKIEIMTADYEDEKTLGKSLDVLDEILTAQGTDVAPISGAEATSAGIIEGVSAALYSAVNP
ncbi:MAG: FMN-binding protein [Clostridiales Family XIII bacterium]|jgi:hypothetical protein|nr:FMN-binding protein [Clostridiales Family XIII bacterium]